MKKTGFEPTDRIIFEIDRKGRGYCYLQKIGKKGDYRMPIMKFEHRVYGTFGTMRKFEIECLNADTRIGAGIEK